MLKCLKVGAALLLIGGSAATTYADSPASVTPGVNVAPIPGGGVVVTPNVTTTVPLPGGVILNGGVQVPLIIPQSGPVQVTPPSVGFGFKIPL